MKINIKRKREVNKAKKMFGGEGPISIHLNVEIACSFTDQEKELMGKYWNQGRGEISELHRALMVKEAGIEGYEPGIVQCSDISSDGFAANVSHNNLATVEKVTQQVIEELTGRIQYLVALENFPGEETFEEKIN
jgi:hypothetical protein